jgi:cysteine synthase
MATKKKMTDYEKIMSQRPQIIKDSVGIDYDKFELGGLAFDYEKMMDEAAYSIKEMEEIQGSMSIGNTPLMELHNITALARKCAPKGKGARIFIKDEAANPSGSFKARRAAISAYQAKKQGYKGILAATSGNYGAAVAACAVKQGLECIIVQECYDSKGVGQPEIIEKARKCEAYGAEVIQTTVGPELFYVALDTLKKTKFFNASLYTPFGIAGVETLGTELARQTKEQVGKYPDVVVCTNAGGGNLTGTARGLRKAGAKKTQVVAASVNLKGLHMADDNQFNKKSFTTGHTGFGIPFSTLPDRSDVPRSAARALRYMDRYVTVEQGEVMYMTELLAKLEGLERGPAGNTSLAAAFSIAQEMPEDAVLVVQETEYTAAGKHIQSQLAFGVKRGIKLSFGNPSESVNGKNIIFPDHPKKIKAVDLSLPNIRKSYVKNACKNFNRVPTELTAEEIKYLAEETRLTQKEIKALLPEVAEILSK